MTRITAKKIALHKVRLPTIWVVRLRTIHQPGHDCLCPPYLHLAFSDKRPHFFHYWGGHTCLCDVLRILNQTG